MAETVIENLDHRHYIPFRKKAKQCELCDNRLAEWSAEGHGFRVAIPHKVFFCTICMRSELTEEHDARRVVYQALQKLDDKELRDHAFRCLRAGDDQPVRVICEEHLQDFLEFPGYFPKWDIEEERKKKAEKAAKKTAGTKKRRPKTSRGAAGQLLPSKDMAEVKEDVESWMVEMEGLFEETEDDT